MDYIYILRCGDGSLYTGWTNRLSHRLAAHAAGKGAKYTKAHLPVELVYTECFDSRSEALRREAAIKKMTRAEKEEMIGAKSRSLLSSQSKIYYLMGKSASGKDHFCQALLEQPALSLRPLIIYTTRPIRDGEEDGVAYHFTDEAHVKAWEQSGKIIEMRTYQTVAGDWRYLTLDDGSFDETGSDILAIGTLESYRQLCAYFGAARMVPLYIEVDNGIRLERALARERSQAAPKYAEMCRRFLADEEDFAEAKLQEAGVTQVFCNDGKFADCLEALSDHILLSRYGVK